MAILNYSTTISIDTNHSTIHLFSMLGNDESSIMHRIKNYSGVHFDEAFFVRFKEVITEFASEMPSESVRKISLILPDNAVSLDTVNVPTMKSKNMTKNALNLTLGEIYRNSLDLRIQTYIAAQNKQYTTFSTAAIQKRLLSSLYSICAENKMLVDTTTYASGSTVGAVSTLNPKLRNATYLFLDIKDTYSRFIFIVNGRCVGFFPLPFGLEFLARPRYVQEDMLFDHTMADLTVLNACEKAKAKKLTVLTEDHSKTEGLAEEGFDAEDNTGQAEDVAEDPESSEDVEFTEDATDEKTDSIVDPFAMSSGQRIIAPKYMAKKTPRQLPRFMQRPIPDTVEGIACENFRVFVKWALSLLISNEKITQLGAPEFVCVNIPDGISFVLDYANEEMEENRIEFKNIGAGGYEPMVLDNLELYGGFFPKAIHQANKF